MKVELENVTRDIEEEVLRSSPRSLAIPLIPGSGAYRKTLHPHQRRL